MRPRIWQWNGKPGSDPLRVRFDGLKKLENIEGLSFFNHRGLEKLFIVCDDGDDEEDRGGTYVVVPLSELEVANQ